MSGDPDGKRDDRTTLQGKVIRTVMLKEGRSGPSTKSCTDLSSSTDTDIRGFNSDISHQIWWVQVDGRWSGWLGCPSIKSLSWLSFSCLREGCSWDPFKSNNSLLVISIHSDCLVPVNIFLIEINKREERWLFSFVFLLRRDTVTFKSSLCVQGD